MSNSILTNASAMTALQTLNATNKSMSEVQNRISTGQRVSSAQDNAAYWSIATTMRSDNNALSAVQDALGLGAATVDTMYTALNATVKVVDEIKAKLVAAKQPGVDRGKIQSDINELQNQLRSTSDSAVFNSENWLSSDVATVNKKEIVSSFSRAGGSISIQTIDVDITGVQLFDTNASNAGGSETGILDADLGFSWGGSNMGTTSNVVNIDISAVTDDANDLADLELVIQAVDTQLGKITDAATTLGSVKTRVDLQKDFVGALTDALDRGIGQLVDADMNEESTRLKALQVQQQLGIQALSIANSSSDNILSLFR
ncbi:flagellin [Cohaesibacter sp. ES.047]|uniref:flagellin N-terminal helical domain-containing protein n=1 Tax=Cohaesibacter sp. ES.047 TaxID=1798205 RepID=UPI000BB833E3|nr:flagellin [Cohaesibacter sp. ES.047]SNY92157.1 flagellin [Cohaesibacter sp. ES.047]